MEKNAQNFCGTTTIRTELIVRYCFCGDDYSTIKTLLVAADTLVSDHLTASDALSLGKKLAAAGGMVFGLKKMLQQ